MTRSTSAIVACVAVLTCSLLFTAVATAAPPAGLAKNGRYLWQFEALLNDTFHTKDVSDHNLDFACAGQGCTPNAYWSHYLFTFAAPHGSAFHTSARKFPPGAFGNYPSPVRVKGRVIACDRQERRFLIAYGDVTGLGLDCLTPS